MSDSPAQRAFLGVDIGTSSSKGVLVDEQGGILRTAVREHQVSRPRPGHVEMDGELWWEEFRSISGELLADSDVRVAAVGVSGMEPCALLTDADGVPTRPAILYGVDTRATAQIAEIERRLGADEIHDRSGSRLSSQAVGPKLAWVAEHEPEVWSRSRKIFMPSSWLVYRLTGEYVLDHHSASQCTPLYDRRTLDWHRDWAGMVAPGLDLPPLKWASELAGLTRHAVPGIPSGTPVIVGSIDAWMESASVGADGAGDLFLMYGSTMFLVATVVQPVLSDTLWATVGLVPGTRNLAGGMATSGAITSWLREAFGSPRFEDLLEEAAASGPGARGLLMLPYFAGERTPLSDPDARGVIAGLSLSHTRGDLYRAALEATAMGVRHNIEAIAASGADISRVVAAGGGTRGGLWTQIVSDMCGLPQVIPTVTIGASFGAAFLAARLIVDADIRDWNAPRETVVPDPAVRENYDELWSLYTAFIPATLDISHRLALRERTSS